MIVVDTDVVLEIVKGHQGNLRVLEWARRADETLVTTTVTRADLLTGLELIPPGATRDRVDALIGEVFATIEHVLPYDSGCAPFYAWVVTERRRSGLRVRTNDAIVAAICLHSRLPLATGNLAAFEGLGIDLVDPWKPSRSVRGA